MNFIKKCIFVSQIDSNSFEKNITSRQLPFVCQLREHYKKSLIFYETEFIKNTSHTILCIAKNKSSSDYEKFNKILFEEKVIKEDEIYVLAGNKTISMYENFFCSFSTFVKITSSYKYLLKFNFSDKDKNDLLSIFEEQLQLMNVKVFFIDG